MATAIFALFVGALYLSLRSMHRHEQAKRRQPPVYVGPVYPVRDLGTVDSARTEVGAVR